MLRELDSFQQPFSNLNFYNPEQTLPHPQLTGLQNNQSTKTSDLDKNSSSWPSKIYDFCTKKQNLGLTYGGATMSTSKKIVLIGDQAVGKTTLLKRYSKGTLNTNYKATIGIDFECLKYKILGIPFDIQIWDTAGQERFRAMSSQYYRKAKVILIVADASNQNSIQNIATWNQHVEENITDYQTCFKFVILTKTDLLSEVTKRETYLEVSQIAREINAEFWPCSSTMNQNVEEVFNRAVSLIFIQECFREIEMIEGMKLSSNDQKTTATTTESDASSTLKKSVTFSSYQNYDPKSEPGNFSENNSSRKLVHLTESDVVSLASPSASTINSSVDGSDSRYSDKAMELFKTWFGCA